MRVLIPPAFAPADGAEAQRLGRRLPQVAANLAPVGRMSAERRLNLSIGLPLRNREALDTLIHQLYDPSSPNYRHYLTPEQFGEMFGATETDYQAVINFMGANGLRVTKTHPNRLLVDVQGTVGDVERVMHVTMREYQHPKEGRNFYAPDVEPSLDLSVPILEISGLNNYSLRRPMFHRTPLVQSGSVAPKAGSGPSSTYIGKDFRNAYVPGATNLTGTGQMVGLLQFDAYYASDITSYITAAGISTGVVLTNVAVGGGVSTPGDGNGEVTLDIQMVISMAPGVSKIFVFEAPNDNSVSWSTMLSTMASYTNIHQFSCSWGDTSAGTPDYISEGIFLQMATQGQSFYNASGDSDAFSGGIPFPSESTNITQVGGTTLTMTGTGAAYSSETVWNWGSGTGSSGGVSANFQLPYYQLGISMTANKGSTTMRNVPDVALTADNVYNIADNGATTGGVGGTSCAAPLWAGFTALINQQAAANGQGPVGFLNPAIYTIGKGSSYSACFHDTTTGNNGTSTKYPAVTGFDLCTGWGTPTGTNLINALSGPAPAPGITSFSPPSGFVNTTVTITGSNFVSASSVIFNGTSASFTVISASQITATVPLTATTGPIAVVTPSGTATSANNFTVLAGAPAPSVSGFSPAFGPVGVNVVVTGLYFTNVSAVSFNGTSASFTVDSLTQITTTVPAGVTTGPISVVTTSGSAASTSSFSVLSGDGSPSITSFTPASGMANSLVVITGVNFAGVTAVTFNGASASFTVNSLAQITATVPSTATTGPIAVTNPYGTGTSSSSFTLVASPQVAISQIYGGGGDTSATYLNDYVELYNRGSVAVDLSTWSVQYAKYNGSSWSKTPLTGTIQPGHYYLVREASGGSVGSALPTPDASGSMNMSATRGKVALVENQTTLAVANPAGGAGIADFVGYGSATAYEGSGPAPAPSTTTAIFRASGGATDTDNNSADFTAGTPAPRNSSTGPSAPDLAVTVSHSGSFAQGDTGRTYTIIVSNVGAAASAGTVTVVDTLPAGLTATAISGTGWSANLSTLTCTRSDALAAAAAYPAITVTVDVSGSAASSVTNSAAVSGGGESNTANNTGTDPTTITFVAAPVVTTGTATGVGTTTATLNGTVNPNGLSTTAQFQYGLTTAYGSTNVVAGTLTGTSAQAVNASLTGLTPGTTYHFRLSATNSLGAANGSDQTFTTTALVPDLAIALSHTGNFTQGDPADTYTIIVTNIGAAASSGTVTVTDAPPSGLTITSMSGTGWSYNSGASTCTRSDALAAGTNYPAITVTVSVSASAPNSVTNTATVSGGGDTSPANNTANDPTTINSSGGSVSYSGVLAGWDVSGQTAGFGTSPLTASTNAPNLTVGGLTRGSGVGTSGSGLGAGRGWGGDTWTNASELAATNANRFATFSVAANTGYKVSFTNISQLNYRRSGTGPLNGELQYQVGTSSFVDLMALSYSSSSSSGASLGTTNLSGISALQNIGAGTNVTFRIVNWGASGSGGTWYIFDVGNSTADDLEVQGTVALACSSPTALTPTASPASTVCAGTAITLTANATGGSSPYTYLWKTNGTAISGATGSTYSIASPKVADALNYTVDITSSCGGTASTSPALALIVNAIPSTPTAGNNGPVCAGSTLTLTTPTVSGATYSWTGPNGFTSSAQNPTVSSSATVGMSGTYYVTVAVSGCASAAGSTAVTVNPAPVGGTTTPTTAAVGSGTGTNITLTGQTGSIVKWQSSTDGSNWLDIASTANPLSTGALTQTTEYRAVVQSGVCATVASSVATVNVNALVAPTLWGIERLSATSVKLTFSGPPSQTYKVLDATDVEQVLSSWNVLTNGTFGSSPETFTDTAATDAARFYKITSP